MIRDYQRSGGECYGHFLENECFDCEYAESCRYVSETDCDNAHRVRNSVDINKNEFRGVNLSETTKYSVQNVKNEFIAINDVVEIFSYIAKSDETTFKMTFEVLNNPHATQSEIARKFGVSRQRIHSAILEICQKDKRLKNLFCLLMKRKTLLNNIDKNSEDDKKKDNNNQLELF